MKSRQKTVLAIVLLLSGGAAWRFSLPNGMEAAAGTNLVVDIPTSSKPDFQNRETIRFGTLNIHSGRGRDGRFDLGRVADSLTELDFTALNEVQGAGFNQPDQAEQLGHRLNRYWLFAPAERQFWGGQFGNAFLTNLPISAWQRIPLPRQFDRSWRNMVFVDLTCSFGDKRTTVHVLLTHLVRRSEAERRQQLETVLALYLALAEPAVLLGDLNSTSQDPIMQRLLATPGVVDAIGEKSPANPPERIDWIIARGLRCVAAGMRDNGASDHPMFWAELELSQ